jgi:predicted ester cyclase
MIKGGISGFALGIQFMLADGDKVAAHWTATGTHSGELMGVPATGRPIDFRGVSVVRIEDGKIVDIWGASDWLGLMQQLGAFPC